MTSTASSHPIDRFIPWFFVAFFVALALLLGWFVHLAISTDTGVISKNAYKEGLAYNAVIEKQARQDELGWKGELELTRPNGEASEARFTLRDHAGNPVHNATAQLTLIRPTQAGHDITVPLRETRPGFYEAAFRVPLPGLWHAHVAARTGKDEYQMQKRVVLTE